MTRRRLACWLVAVGALLAEPTVGLTQGLGSLTARKPDTEAWHPLTIEVPR